MTNSDRGPNVRFIQTCPSFKIRNSKPLHKKDILELIDERPNEHALKSDFIAWFYAILNGSGGATLRLKVKPRLMRSTRVTMLQAHCLRNTIKQHSFDAWQPLLHCRIVKSLFEIRNRIRDDEKLASDDIDHRCV